MQLDTLAAAGGALLVGAAAVRSIFAIVDAARRRAHYARWERQRVEDFKRLASRVFSDLDPVLTTQCFRWTGTRKFKVVRRVDETPDGTIRSFYLRPVDDAPIPFYRPGQFLTFAVPAADGGGRFDGGQPVQRCYSLSDNLTAGQTEYRVSVKRIGAPAGARDGTPPGLVSGFFHDHLVEGEVVDVLPPAGSFYVDQTSSRPIVLVAGGIGITPLLSMLNWLIATQSRRETWLFYGVRNRGEHAFYDHIKRICESRANVRVVVFYSRPSRTCREGVDFDVKGHIDVGVMNQLLKARNYEFYLCGPPAMMTAVNVGLASWGVPQTAIKSELFSPKNPAMPRRQLDRSADHRAAPVDGGMARFRIEFARSKINVTWSQQVGSLLELAEACGINAHCACRAGQCGTCKVSLKSGCVVYLSQPVAELDINSCLPCIAHPASDLVLDM